jgi:site-specific recombinase XerD
MLLERRSKMAVDTSVKAFGAHLERVRSAVTAEKYPREVQAFLDILKSNGIVAFRDFPPNTLQLFVDALIDKGYSASTVKVKHAAVEKYLQWARDQGVFVPRLAAPEMPKQVHVIRDVLSPEEIPFYLGYAETLLEEPQRTAAILLPCTGLRVSELLGLHLQDIRAIHFETKEEGLRRTYAFRVVGKGDKERTVPILAEGAPYLLRYLNGYRKTVGGTPLFPSPGSKKGNKVLNDREIRGALATLREPLHRRFTPHTMRRTYLVTLWRRGVDPVTIAKVAGHANVQTLFTHYLNLDEHDLARAVHQPRQR